MCKEGWSVGLEQKWGYLHEGGGHCLKYLIRGWNRKGRETKILKGGQAGSRGGCLKKGGLETPCKVWTCYSIDSRARIYFKGYGFL